MASSLLALIDDIASLLDDVAVLSKVAARKTSGIVGDDLALNAEQVTGVTADRELPVVWAVAKGSFVNKLILVPAALAISAFLPVAIQPLLMLGGLFLCFEGVEKVAHKLLHSPDEDAREHAAHVSAIADTQIDVVAFERAKVKGAIRTDFVLSAEIIVITLGTMATAAIGLQIAALSIIAIAATVLVYGVVAGIVKLDDLGLKLHRQAGASANHALQRRIGAGILRAAPVMMKAHSVIGTIAMFTVGGSIIAHGAPPVEHLVETAGHHAATIAPALGTIAKTVAEALVGIVSGGVLVILFTLGKKVMGRARK
jgi:hypothetical protein